MKKILSSLITFILFFVWGLIGSFVIEDFSYLNWKTHVWMIGAVFFNVVGYVERIIKYEIFTKNNM